MAPLTRYGAQFRLARALLDYLSGLDPSAVGLVQALLTLMPRRGDARNRRSSPTSDSQKALDARPLAVRVGIPQVDQGRRVGRIEQQVAEKSCRGFALTTHPAHHPPDEGREPHPL